MADAHGYEVFLMEACYKFLGLQDLNFIIIFICIYILKT